MRSRIIIKKLIEDGWVEQPSKATSHRQFRHPTKPGTVTVAHPNADVAIGTIKSIEARAA
jgi:predicted RNA binding protein YcfA (HicA-like mRNA interferase family)